MKKELSPSLSTILGIAAAVVVLGIGVFYFMKSTGAPAEDVDLAKKQAAVEHQQFQGKIGGPPDAGAGEAAARARRGH